MKCIIYTIPFLLWLSWAYRKEITKFFKELWEDFKGFRKNDKGFSALGLIIELLMISVLAFMIFLFIDRGIFAGKEIAVRALEKQGYQQVEIIGKSGLLVGLQGCEVGDAAKFTATALNPIGKKVDIFVCAGWPFKGATIRTD